MADEPKPAPGGGAPKPDAKPAGGSSPTSDPFVEIVFLLLALFIGLQIVNQVIKVVTEVLSGNIPDRFKAFFDAIAPEIFILKVVMALLSVIAIFWIVYVFQKLSSLRRNEAELLYPETTSTTSNSANTNPHWERILSHVESLNENDWRLAIIESDILLSRLLDNLSIPGDTIGEKLKAVDKSDFTTVDQAFEAHKIRNQITHEGSGYLLNQREAKRVIDLYRVVFNEFQVI